MQKEWLLWVCVYIELKQTVLNSCYVKTMGVCPSLKIATKNQNFLENSKPRAQFRLIYFLQWQFISQYDTHTAQGPGSLYWCHAVMRLQITRARSFACRGRSGLPDWPLFLGQISEIWPRFKLVGLKNFIWPFGIISSWLTLRNLFDLLALSWLFYAENFNSEQKYYYSIFLGT